MEILSGKLALLSVFALIGIGGSFLYLENSPTNREVGPCVHGTFNSLTVQEVKASDSGEKIENFKVENLTYKNSQRKIVEKRQCNGNCTIQVPRKGNYTLEIDSENYNSRQYTVETERISSSGGCPSSAVNEVRLNASLSSKN